MSQAKSFDLAESFVHLGEDGAASILPVGDDFWEKADELFSGGRLLSVIASDGNWPCWEMHPAGDEVIMLLSGAMTLMLDGDGGIRRQPMTPGQTAVVPRGTWHTADVAKAGRALFVTPGDDTEQRPR